MKAEYITHYGSDLSAVNAARVSMDKESEWKIVECSLATQDSDTWFEKHLDAKDEKLIGFLAKNKHFSCFEHQGATLRLKVPLFVRSQIHRHRTFSYNEISRRYVKDNLEFYWPDKWRKAAENVKQGSSDDAAEYMYSGGNEMWDNVDEYIRDEVLSQVLIMYKSMVDNGVCAEQARMILPQNLYTSFYMTGNLRNWAHFLKLRLDPHAQKEVRDIAKMCAAIIEPLFPVSYKALISATE